MKKYILSLILILGIGNTAFGSHTDRTFPNEIITVKITLNADGTKSFHVKPKAKPKAPSIWKRHKPAILKARKVIGSVLGAVLLSSYVLYIARLGYAIGNEDGKKDGIIKGYQYGYQNYLDHNMYTVTDYSSRKIFPTIYA